jgi:hypothetical protein
VIYVESITNTRRRGTMPKCGACGWEFSERTLAKHAETACGEEDSKAGAKPYAPEIDDIIRSMEEESGKDLL